MSIATGSKLVFIAGQVAWHAGSVTVGEGDLSVQVEQRYLNIGTALAEVGASFADGSKLNVYVVDWTPDKRQALGGSSPRLVRASRGSGGEVRRWRGQPAR